MSSQPTGASMILPIIKQQYPQASISPELTERMLSSQMPSAFPLLAGFTATVVASVW